MASLHRQHRSAAAAVEVLAALAALAACDAQEGDAYVGEPLARLTGPVVDARDEPTEALPSDLAVTLVWMAGPDGPDSGEPWSFERTRVEAGFPARFTLDVIAAPPAELLDVYGLALGIFLVSRPGDETPFDDLLGLARGHVLLYLVDPADLSPLVDDELAARLGLSDAGPGLHLMDVVPPDDASEIDLDTLRPAPAGFATEVVIELLDPDLLEADTLRLPDPW